MTGVQYVVDEKGKRKAVVIDLEKHAKLWEDFCDVMIAKQRSKEPRESLSSVKRRFRQLGKL